MERHRLAALERLVAIQTRIRQREEWRRQALQAQAAEAREQVRALILTRADTGPMAGLFADMTARRLHRLAASIHRLDAAAADQAGLVLAESAREKQATRKRDAARSHQERFAQDRTLAAMMDAQQAQRAAQPKRTGKPGISLAGEITPGLKHNGR